MTDNPLAGISVPSFESIAEVVVSRMGPGTINLSIPLQRRRLLNFVASGMETAFGIEMERALTLSVDRAIRHVFAVAKDTDYQEKKKRRRQARAKSRAERREKEEAVEREARMDYSKRTLVVSKKTIQ